MYYNKHEDKERENERSSQVKQNEKRSNNFRFSIHRRNQKQLCNIKQNVQSF
nr:MAG TPA: hypothetical protein [Caudoviricetes sp.]